MRTTRTTAVPPYLLRIPPEDVDEIVEAVRDILSRGELLLGPYTRALESGFAAATGRSQCVAVSSGTTALEIILRHLDVRGRAILVPANTNYATALSVLNAGGIVRLYDGGLYPDMASLREQIDGSAAVIVVHIGGHVTPDVDAISALCHARGIPLIEDAAHAHGSTFHGRAAGALSHAAAFSLFPTKVMTSGEGGLVVTDDDGLALVARRLRNQGKSESGEHVLPGNSWRITEMGAAVALTQLRRLEEACRFRAGVMARYAEAAARSRLLRPLPATGCAPNGYKAILLTEDKAAVTAELRRRDILPSGNVYEVPLHRLPVFRDVLRGSFPVAERFSQEHVCLPCWYGMSSSEVDKVAAAIAEI